MLKKTLKKNKKLINGGTPPKYDGQKYNYMGTKFGHKNKNKLKAEYKNAKKNTPQYEELNKWKKLQKEKFNISDKPQPEPELEPQPEPQQDLSFSAMPSPHPNSVEAMRRKQLANRPTVDPNKFSFKEGNLPQDIIGYYINNFALDKNDVVNEEICKRIQETCELFPRTCYLNRDFLEKYIRRCQIIAKTGLYRQRILDTPMIDVVGDPRKREWKMNYDNIIPQRYFVQDGDWKTHWRSNKYGFPSTSYEITRVLDLIPKTQMNPKAKQAFLRVFDSLFRPLQIRGNTRQLVDQRRSYNYMVQDLYNNPEKLELFIQMWRSELEKEKMKPKQIEYTIQRFLKTFYE